MFGGKELDRLRQQKQALVLESGVNRLAVTAELQNLRSSTRRITEVAFSSRKLAPLLLLLPALAGFLAVGVRRRPGSWLSRLASAAKWIVPLYRLWRTFSSKPKRSESSA